MSEVLVRYAAEVRGDDGTLWVPQACAGISSDGLWHGWIEFVSGDRAIRTPRETEQASRDALMYWAQGLTAAYLEGALARATTKRTEIPREPLVQSRFEGPAPAIRSRRAILDPFSTFLQGEDLLRGQLAALSRDNLVAIVEDYAIPVRGMSDMSSARLVAAIVGAVKDASITAENQPSAAQSRPQPENPAT